MFALANLEMLSCLAGESNSNRRKAYQPTLLTSKRHRTQQI